MSIDFSTLQGLTIPEGVVTQIADAAGNVIWSAVTNKPVILEVKKITSDTYAAETTYTGEQFILLDIYPKTNGTVNVTYGGLTKTITDTSGAAEPNAQQVFFGTFNGVSDSVATPASGTLTIEGDYAAFACGGYQEDSKNLVPPYYDGITEISDMGIIQYIPDIAFSGGGLYECSMTSVNIPNSVDRIGKKAFYDCPLVEVTISKNISYIGYLAFGCMNNITLKTVRILADTPPEIGSETTSEGVFYQRCFAPVEPADDGTSYFSIEKIIVPKGCGNVYKAAAGWSEYADYIVEAS